MSVFFYILIFVVGLWMILKSSDLIIKKLSNISVILGVSKFSVSFFLMAFATTLPEFGVAISAVISGSSYIAVGNAIGTNIVNLSLILGLVAIISGGVSLGNRVISKRERLSTLVTSVTPVLFLMDGYLSRTDGIIFLLLFGFHMWWLVREKRGGSKIEKTKEELAQEHIIKRHPIFGTGKVFKEIFVFVLFAVLLVGGSYAVVSSSSYVADFIGIPDILIGFFLLAIGTSLPELFFAIRASEKHSGDLAVGDLFGSSAINSSWILGIVGVMSPGAIGDSLVLWVGIFMMIVISLLASFFAKTKGGISRKEGYLLVFVYIIFLIIQIYTGFLE